MPRFIVLNEKNMVISTRTGVEIVPGEIQSDAGECGDYMQADGSFMTPEPEPVVPEPGVMDYLLDLDYRVSMIELGLN